VLAKFDHFCSLSSVNIWANQIVRVPAENSAEIQRKNSENSANIGGTGIIV
jgi:hypothetical protein